MYIARSSQSRTLARNLSNNNNNNTITTTNNNNNNNNTVYTNTVIKNQRGPSTKPVENFGQKPQCVYSINIYIYIYI